MTVNDPHNHPPEATPSPCCQNRTDIASAVSVPTTDLSTPSLPAPWITGAIPSATGDIPVVATKLTFADRLGSWKARWGIKRMNFRIPPRLYAFGRPTETSPVFVTANYKMSFDRLRSSLDHADGWILVLDTRGINVWCAAGKGTFGTDEITRMVEAVRLARIVTHRTLILPQLGAPGVSAHTVKERCGFRVIYGPIRARDLNAFLQSGMKATPEMRQVTFTLPERLVLIPVDAIKALKYALFIAACFLLLSGLGSGFFSLNRVATFGLTNAALPLVAALAGVILPAALLPWLPGRAFATKGAWAGLVPMIAVVLLAWLHPTAFRNWLSIIGWLCLIPAITSFAGMNFTGSSTYTSLSGVRKEMRFALPAQISCAAIGLILWAVGLFV